jgi:hypothetical protein
MTVKRTAGVGSVLLLGGATLYASFSGAAERSAHANFVLRCCGCHGTEGRGVAGSIPNFQDFIGAFAADDAGRTYVLHVPGVVSANLSDSETAAVMNYVMTKWGGTSLSPSFTPFTSTEVAMRRARPVADVIVLRRQIVERLRAAGIATADYPWP